MVDQSISNFVTEVGFPIAAFCLMTSLYMKQGSNQRSYEERYDKLSNNFIETIKQMQTDHSDTLKRIIDRIDEQNKDMKRFFEHICSEHDEMRDMMTLNKRR